MCSNCTVATMALDSINNACLRDGDRPGPLLVDLARLQGVATRLSAQTGISSMHNIPAALENDLPDLLIYLTSIAAHKVSCSNIIFLTYGPECTGGDLSAFFTTYKATLTVLVPPEGLRHLSSPFNCKTN